MSEFKIPAADDVPQMMCIQLHNSTLNNKGFIDSCSSTSSPDSVRSLCGLDVELPDGMMGRTEATSDNDSGIQSPECRPDDNDNSVSVYLDATEGGWKTDYDDQDDITLVLDQKRELDNDYGKLRAPNVSSEDEDGEDGEESFFSLSTSDMIMRNKTESDIQAWSGDQPSTDTRNRLHQGVLRERFNAKNLICTSSKGQIVIHHEVLQDSIELHNKQIQKQNLISTSWLNQKTPPEPMEVEDEDQTLSIDKSLTKLPQNRLHLQSIQTSTEMLNQTNNLPTMVSENEVHRKVFEESMNIQYEKIQATSVQNISNVTEDQKECPQRNIRRLNDQTLMKSSSSGPSVKSVNDLHLQALHSPTEDSQMNQSIPPCVDLRSRLYKTTEVAASSAPPQNLAELSKVSKDLPNTKDNPGQSHTSFHSKPSLIKQKMVIKHFSRPNLKNVKAKVVSRSASAPRLAKNGPSEATPDLESNLPSPRKKEAKKIQRVDVKKVSPSSSQAEVGTPISDAYYTWPEWKTKPDEERQSSERGTNQERCCQKVDIEMEKTCGEILVCSELFTSVHCLMFQQSYNLSLLSSNKHQTIKTIL